MWLHAEQGFRGTVVDLDTGQPVRKVLRIKDTMDELEAVAVDGAGNAVKNAVGDEKTYRAVGRFRFVPRPGNATPKVLLGAPACTKCGSVLTLPGDDLCSACKAKDRGQRHKMTAERVSNLLLPRKCEQCSRQAVWSVSDEVNTTPEAGGKLTIRGRKFRGVYYARAAVVGRRWFCEWHFKPPRLLDARGEVVQEIQEKLRQE